MAGQGSAERGANRDRSVKKCEPTKVPAFGGRLCLPDSAGAGPGRLPALLGQAFSLDEMVLDLVLLGQALAWTKWSLTWPLTWPLKGLPP